MTHSAPTSREPLRFSFKNLDRFQTLLIGLSLLRLLLAALIWLDVLPIGRDGWKLYHGGDEALMGQLAATLLHGDPQPSVVGIGQAFHTMIWFALFNVEDYNLVAPPLTFVNGLILGPASIYVVGLLARHITRDDRIALVAAGLWALMPLLMYFGFFWHPDYLRLRDTMTPRVAWLNGLADGPGIFIVLLSMTLAARLMDQGEEARGSALLAVAFCAGLAISFRIHMLFFAAGMGLYLLLAHGWRLLPWVLAGFVLGYLPQAIYNQMAFGIPIWSGYISLIPPVNIIGYSFWFEHFIQVMGDTFNPRNLLNTVTGLIGRRPWLLIPGIIGLAVIGLVSWRIWRARGWQAAALLIGVPLAYLLPLSISGPFRSDLVRFSMPVMPSLMITAFYLIRLFTAAPGAAPSPLLEEEG